ncbi:hypothetical protein [Xenorhabdus indica]|uniref:hypothetical protein n=1 Tax=Xenorhabdus indica TaxID=333964 RepID=UPI0016571D29|nr:hypothetical protein [Xenorhabdus indica]MBC8947035.1 hypothetical protein [Xenorhabdus indica]
MNIEEVKPVAYMIFDELYNEVIAYKENEQIANRIAEVHNLSPDMYHCKVIPLYRHPEK